MPIDSATVICDVVDGVAVPHALEHRVAETEDEDVLHRLLAEVVVDAEDLLLVEDREQLVVELPRGLEVVPEGLLDDDPRSVRQVFLCERPDTLLERRRRHRQVDQAARPETALLDAGEALLAALTKDRRSANEGNSPGSSGVRENSRTASAASARNFSSEPGLRA